MFSSKEQSRPTSGLLYIGMGVITFLYLVHTMLLSLAIGGLALTQLLSEPQQFQSEVRD